MSIHLFLKGVLGSPRARSLTTRLARITGVGVRRTPPGNAVDGSAVRVAMDFGNNGNR